MLSSLKPGKLWSVSHARVVIYIYMCVHNASGSAVAVSFIFIIWCTLFTRSPADNVQNVQCHMYIAALYWNKLVANHAFILDISRYYHVNTINYYTLRPCAKKIRGINCVSLVKKRYRNLLMRTVFLHDQVYSYFFPLTLLHSTLP